MKVGASPIPFKNRDPQQITIVGSEPSGDVDRLFRAVRPGKPPFALTFPGAVYDALVMLQVGRVLRSLAMREIFR
jgi:hypothetical protein